MNIFMKNKKGFTLVELLAVITILAIIAVIAVPVITDVINDAEENTAKRSVDLFARSFKTAISDSALNDQIIEMGVFTTTDGHSFTDQISGKKINVTYNGDAVKCDTIMLFGDGNLYLKNCVVGNYELEDYKYGVKQVCTAVTESEYGNVPTGEYNYGDEYICNVDGINSYHFYVLENGDNTSLTKGTTGTAGKGEVALIMDHDFPNQVAWCGDETLCKTNGNWDNTKGPLTAIAYLKEQTDSWTNFISTQLSLITSDQAGGALGKGFLSTIQNGMWTGTQGVYDDTASTVTYAFLLGHHLIFGEADIDEKHYIRPVITIPKDFIY